MTLYNEQSKVGGALKEVHHALPERFQDWLKDIVTWVKEEIDQDPKHPGKNYREFLQEQTKVFAYQSGLEPSTITALVHMGFQQKQGQSIDSYAHEKWKEHGLLVGQKNPAEVLNIMKGDCVMSDEKVQIPEGYYYHNDLGEVLPIPTETSRLEASVPRIAQAEKAATLRGDRPSGQTLRNQRAHRQAVRNKYGQGRER